MTETLLWDSGKEVKKFYHTNLFFTLSSLVWAKQILGCTESVKLAFGRIEQQSHWILPWESGWRISFHFTMTFLWSQWWSAHHYLLPLTSPLRSLCCTSLFSPSFVNLSISHFYMDSTEQFTPCQQEDHIPTAHLSSHQLLALISMLALHKVHMRN